MLQGLYASILIGNCTCHSFGKLPGHTGGFYHYEMMEKIQMITSGEEAEVKFPTSEELIDYTTK